MAKGGTPRRRPTLKPVQPKDIIGACQWCGLHLHGPFKGRYDVPLEEISAHLSQFTGKPAGGVIVATPFREGGTIYGHAGGATGKLEPWNGEMCEDCFSRSMQEIHANSERRRAALAAPEPEQPEAPTGTDGGQAPKTSDEGANE